MAIEGKKTPSEKKYYNLGELKTIFEQRYSEYITEKKYRERFSEIFKVIAIQPKCLQGGKPTGVYMIPATSIDFIESIFVSFSLNFFVSNLKSLSAFFSISLFISSVSDIIFFS